MDSLTTENAGAYWQSRWVANATGWRTMEADRAVFDANLRALGAAVKEHNQRHASTGSGDEAANDHDDDVLATRSTAFVPLCGDTFAVRFLVNRYLQPVTTATSATTTAAVQQVSFDEPLHAPSTQAVPMTAPPRHCVVMAVDIAPESIQRQMQQNFPEFAFEKVETQMNDDTKAGTQCAFDHHRLRLSAAASASSSSATSTQVVVVDVHLFAGDLFEVARFWTSAAALFPPVQFIYDRASMVAMHPSLRQDYANTLVALMGLTTLAPGDSQKNSNTVPPVCTGVNEVASVANPLIFLELVVRPAALDAISAFNQQQQQQQQLACDNSTRLSNTDALSVLPALLVGPPFHIVPELVAQTPSSSCSSSTGETPSTHILQQQHHYYYSTCRLSASSSAAVLTPTLLQWLQCPPTEGAAAGAAAVPASEAAKPFSFRPYGVIFASKIAPPTQ